MLEIIKTYEKMKEALAIRKQVFVIEKNVSESLEVDELDVVGSNSPHYLMNFDNKYVGTFRYVEVEPGVIRLQRFAILSDYRSKGIGSKAIKELESILKEKHYRKVVLDSQVTAIDFYTRNGYEVVSDLFEEAGIMHRKMEKHI